MKEREEGGRRGGAKKRQKKLWATLEDLRKLKGRGGSGGRWSRSRTGTEREREERMGSRHDGTETRDAQVGK